MPTPQRATLAQQLAEDLRLRIVSGEFAAGERVPSEAELSRQHNLSRVTVRTALRALESQGLLEVRHGLGSFVSDFGPGIRTGLQELRSISETIRERGQAPAMQRHSSQRRGADEHEASKLGIGEGDEVTAVERLILADDRAVAFSYDVVPTAIIPSPLLPRLGVESLFATLTEAGLDPRRALAEVHAVHDPDIGWGTDRPDAGLYVLLDQVHLVRRGVAVAWSRTYFVEGRFQFVVLRTR